MMDTAYYGHVLAKEGRPANDGFGAVFDPNCVKCLKEIIDKTGAKIVVTSSRKSLMSSLMTSMRAISTSISCPG
ncbi:MAG: hypothetical protein IKU00_05380 [Bacteroidales bacterium]|nr:hypothetical protein [Bacteroidales bacterium]